MISTLRLLWMVAIPVTAAWSVTSLASSAVQAIPDATPVGITIEAKHQHFIYQDAQLDRPPPPVRMYADDRGRSLYMFDGDLKPAKSECSGSCLSSWAPALAGSASRPVPGWSIMRRADGARQWAREGRPLYTYLSDAFPGDTNGDGIDGKWHLAVYEPAVGIRPPPGIAIANRSDSVDAPVFTDMSGKTLYMADGDNRPGRSNCNDSCAKRWPPLEAAELATAHGEWSIIRRQDGTRQWAYRGQPVYMYSGDAQPGQASGEAEKGWHIALAVRPFTPPGVRVGRTIQGWATFTTAGGFTLYAIDQYIRSIGYSVNNPTPPTPDFGRTIGLRSCTRDCLAPWKPFVASRAARSTGYWSVVSREDGTRQWAYKGYPLYTYKGDKQPGDSFGRMTYILAGGPAGLGQRVAFANDLRPLYWRIASP